MKHVMRFLKDCEASIHIEYSIIALMIGVGVLYRRLDRHEDRKQLQCGLRRSEMNRACSPRDCLTKG